MKELAVSAIGATGNFGCSDDIFSFLSEFSHYTPSLSTAQIFFFFDIKVIRLS